MHTRAHTHDHRFTHIARFSYSSKVFLWPSKTANRPPKDLDGGSWWPFELYNRSLGNSAFHMTIHLTMLYNHTKISCKRISSSDNILKSGILILIILSLFVNLFLQTANQSFWKTIWLIMMHHCTKFGSKKVKQLQKISSGQTVIDIYWFSNFAVILTLNTTIQCLSRTLWLMVMYCQTKFGRKRFSCSKDTVEIVIFWSDELL